MCILNPASCITHPASSKLDLASPRLPFAAQVKIFQGGFALWGPDVKSLSELKTIPVT
jgi:hypothetical protein